MHNVRIRFFFQFTFLAIDSRDIHLVSYSHMKIELDELEDLASNYLLECANNDKVFVIVIDITSR